MVDRSNCVQLGLACADACQDLAQRIDGGRADQPDQSSLRAIEQFTTWVGFANHILGSSLTDLPIAGPWLGSRSGWSSGAKGARSLAVSTQSTMKIQSRIGGWIWTTFAIILTCVTSLYLAVAESRSQVGLATKTNRGVSNVRHETSCSHVNAHNPSYDASSPSLVVPNARHNVSNANTVKPDVHVQGDLADTHTVSSHIHPDLSKNQNADVQNRAVSTPRTPACPRIAVHLHLGIRQVRDLAGEESNA